MVLRLLGNFQHIRYYSGNIQKLLEHIGFELDLYRKCNLHLNIFVICKKTFDLTIGKCEKYENLILRANH